MRVIVITYPTPPQIKDLIELKDDDYVIAVDQAVFYVLEQKIPINLAVGDFDSLENTKLLYQLDYLLLNMEKDETDTFRAVLEGYSMHPEELIVVGGLGGKRVEHAYANLLMFNRFPNVKLINEHSQIIRLEKGEHKIEYDGYVSIFAQSTALVSLEGFKYPLMDYRMELFDSVGISNEITGQYGIINILDGAVLVFMSKRD